MSQSVKMNVEIISVQQVTICISEITVITCLPISAKRSHSQNEIRKKFESEN